MINPNRVSWRIFSKVSSDLDTLRQIVKGIEILAQGPALPDPRTLRGEKPRKFFSRDIIVDVNVNRRNFRYEVIDRPRPNRLGLDIIDSYIIYSGEEVVARAYGKRYLENKKAK